MTSASIFLVITILSAHGDTLYKFEPMPSMAICNMALRNNNIEITDHVKHRKATAVKCVERI